MPVTLKQRPMETATIAPVRMVVMLPMRPLKLKNTVSIYVSDTDEELRYNHNLETKPSYRCFKLGWDPIDNQWAFIIHGACWEIFTTRFGTTGSTQDVALATGMARILSNFNQDSPWHHPQPIGLADPFHPNRNEPTEPSRYETLEDHFEKGWIKIEELRRIISVFVKRCQEPSDRISTRPRLSASTATSTKRPYRSRRSTLANRKSPPEDIFSRLPRELLLCILPRVLFQDLPNLRLASRSIAAVSTLEQLPTSYWKIHFLEDYPYAVPSALGAAPDWRALCFSIPPLLRPDWGSSYWPRKQYGIQADKRRLVWNRLDGVRDLICRTPQGLPVDMANWEMMTADLDAKRRPPRHEAQSVQLLGPLSCELRALRDDETGALYLRRSPWVTREYGLRGIGITMTRLGQRTFISGIRLLRYYKFGTGDSSDSEKKKKKKKERAGSDEVGYTSYASEKVLPVSADEDLRSIRLVYSDGAVTGIRFVFSTSAGINRETDWIKTNASGDDFRLATIHRSCTLLPFSLVGCFDV